MPIHSHQIYLYDRIHIKEKFNNINLTLKIVHVFVIDQIGRYKKTSKIKIIINNIIY